MTPPSSVRATLIALAILCVTTGIVHREVLFGGEVYHMDDAADGYYPSHVAILRALKEGKLPSWERNAWTGFPLIADPYYGAFYPPNVVLAIAGPVRGLGLSVALHTILAGLGMWWLLRRRGVESSAAMFGAISYAMSSFLVERIRHVIFTQLMAWLPLILVALEAYLAERRRRSLFLLALSTAMALLCGALPLLPFVVLVLGAYTIARLVTLRPSVGVLLRVGVALVAGALVAMPQILPTLAHLPESPRSLTTDFSFASSYAWSDLRYLATLIAPNVMGTALRENWYGAYNHWEMAGWYTGVLALAMTPFALRRFRAELFAIFAMTVLAIVLAFGELTPVHRWFFDHVPLYAALRCPVRALVIVVFTLPLLGAEGLARVLAAIRRRSDGGVGRSLFAFGLIVLGLVVCVMLRRGAGLPPGVVATRVAVSQTVLVATLGFALLIAARARLATVFAVAFTLVAAFDLIAVDRSTIDAKPADFARGTERFAAVNWLEAHRGEDRFAPSANGPFRLLNLGLTYAMPSATGYDSYSIWRYVNLLQVINTGAPYPHDRLKDDLAAGAIRRWSSPLVDLLNVRWLIAPYPPAPHWVERFRPARGVAPSARYEPLWDSHLAVYENPRVMPRAFVVHAVSAPGDDAAQARALSSLDPRSTALVDHPTRTPLLDHKHALDPARITAAARDFLRVEVETDAPGLLVVSEAIYPGWSATLDGAPTTLYRADYAFRGVEVPPGKHVVEMRYASRPLRLGLGLGGIGLIGLALCALVL